MYVRVQLSSRTESLVNWLFTLRDRAVNNSFELCYHDSHPNRRQTASCLPRLPIMSKLSFGNHTPLGASSRDVCNSASRSYAAIFVESRRDS